MEYRYLGKTGMKVSSLCLGTMTFNIRGPSTSNSNPVPSRAVDIDTAKEIITEYVAQGGNFIDSADVYHNGESERVVGDWLSTVNRDDFVIATKVRFGDDGNVNRVGLSRKHILQSVDASLKRLNTSYIDLYQIHCWDNATDIEQTLRTLNDLVRDNKIRYIGASNVTGWQLQKMIDYSKFLGMEKVISLQPQYNLLCRQTEWELQDICDKEDVSFVTWGPLKGGLLSGKYKKTEALIDGRLAWSESAKYYNQAHPAWNDYQNNIQYWSILEKLQEISQRNGKTVSQVAIRWLLQRKTVASVIVGVTSIKQLKDNLGAVGWVLSDKEMAELDRVSDIQIPYPYEQVWRCNKSR